MSSAQGPLLPQGSPNKLAKSLGALQGNCAGQSSLSPLSTASQITRMLRLVTLGYYQGIGRGKGTWGLPASPDPGWCPSLGTQQNLALVQASRTSWLLTHGTGMDGMEGNRKMGWTPCVCVYEHAYLNLIFTFLSITNVFTNGCIDYLEDGFGEI